jgi:glycyl-tRNA synthetase beta chain
MAKPLENVVFHAKLGTQGERIDRIAAVAREIAPKVGADPDHAALAARIAKADLASEMVYEFPELQGTMGVYYARAAGLPDEVANACEAHYRPLGPADAVPTEPVSVAVALADKIDMLTGFWAICERPTGSKDPFALRRAALGVIRNILENSARLQLNTFLAYSLIRHYHDNLSNASGLYRNVQQLINDGITDKVADTNAVALGVGDLVNDPDLRILLCEDIRLLGEFLADRLEVALRDRGIRYDVILACFELGGQDDLVLLVNRVRALQDFLATEDGEHLLIAYRRAANIVAIEEKKDGVEYSGTPEAKFAEQDEERALFAALDAAEPAIAAALKAEDFAAAMAEMARLRPVVDTFFDEVTVNAENQIVRRNRLCLLNHIRTVMRQVAVWEAIEG